MFLPVELAQIGDWWRRMAASFGWSAARERAMCARLIVIASELAKLAQKIRTVPEYYVVQILSAQGADQPFDERVRAGHKWYGLDLFNLEHSQVCPPSMCAGSALTPTMRRVNGSMTTMIQ